MEERTGIILVPRSGQATLWSKVEELDHKLKSLKLSITKIKSISSQSLDLWWDPTTSGGIHWLGPLWFLGECKKYPQEGKSRGKVKKLRR